MNLKPFKGPGSTPSRRRFWDKVTQAVVASQKVAGRHVTVDEHQGMGTVINVDDTSARRSGGGFACCTTDTITIAFDSITVCPGFGIVGDMTGVFFLTITEPGHWFGNGSDFTIDGGDPLATGIDVICTNGNWNITYSGLSDPSIQFFIATTTNPVGTTNDLLCSEGDKAEGGGATVTCVPTGACCIDGECSTLSEAVCISDSGTYQGDNTPCDPNPCCTFCGAYPPPCVDEFDLCNTRQACNDDPTFCTGDTVPCDSLWLTLNQYCSDTCELCAIDTMDPFTCEITTECISRDCCADCDGGTSNETANQIFPCP